MRMKKFLLLIAAVMTAGVGMAQKVTLDFTNAAEEWGIPAESKNGVTGGTYSKDGYTISVKAAGQTSGKDNKTYFLGQTKCLLIGKQDATITLPAFDFPVGKIVTTGYESNNVSGKVTFNVFVGETAVSTEATSSRVTHTFDIAEASQAAGTVYTIKVTNANNAQFSKIEIFEAGDEGGGEDPDPEPEPEPTPTEATVAEALAAAANSLLTVKGQAVAITTAGAVIADTTGFIYYYGTPDFKLGDSVTVSGPVTAYNGFNQFSSRNEGTTVVAGENSEVTHPKAVAMDGAAMDAYLTTPVHQYVTVSGKLSVSNNYYNLIVNGATKAQGSLVYPTDEIKEAVSNGDSVTVTGYALYVSGGKYVNIAVTDIKVNTQAELTDPTNTPETAYTVAKALELCGQGETVDLSKEVYVKGIITKVKSLDVSKWPRAQYEIADAASDSTTLLIYNGYYLEGADFTSNDAIKVGDEVIVLGTLTIFNGTKEMNQNNKLVSLNGVTDGINDISAAKGEGKAYDLTGRIANKNAKGIVIVNGKKVVK